MSLPRDKWKAGQSVIHRGRFGTIDLLLPLRPGDDPEEVGSGWAMVAFGHSVEEIPLMALEEPDRDSHEEPPVEVAWVQEGPEDTTERTEYKRALRAEVGPPWECGYFGCSETSESKKQRAAHERVIHGKALRAGERLREFDRSIAGGGDEDEHSG